MANARNGVDVRFLAPGLALVVLAAGVLFYWPSWTGLHGIWISDANTYSHGILVAAISVFACLKAAEASYGDTGAYRPALILLLLGLGVLWLLAFFTTVQIVQSILLPAMIFLALLLVFGASRYRQFTFPLLFFYFAVPVWDYLNPILQQVTIVANQSLLNSLHIPVYIDEALVHLPAGTFEIAEGCSGLHFVIVAAALAAFYGNYNLNSPARRAVFIVCAVALAILMNGIRVSSLIIVGYLTEMQHYLIVTDHYIYGWVLFVVMMGPLYFILSRLERHDTRRRRSDTEPNGVLRKLRVHDVLTAIVCLAVAPVFAYAMDYRVSNSDPIQFELPKTIGEWRLSPILSPHWQPKFSGSLTETRSSYVNDESQRSIELYVNLYRLQSQGNELINSTNSLFDDQHWRELEQSVVDVNTLQLEEQSIPLTKIVAVDGQRAILVYWYVVGDRLTIDSGLVKIRELLLRLRGRSRSGVMALFVRCDTNCDSDHAMLQEFLDANMEDLLTAIWPDVDTTPGLDRGK